MKRIHFLAAELFSYSYDNYEGHLDVNKRFDVFMPENARLMEQAKKEGWSDERIAKECDIDIEKVPDWRDQFNEALEIVDAKTPAESFRRAVRASVEYAVKEGLDDEKSINNLIGQICYRAADLSCILKHRDEPLHEYSGELRSLADDIQDIDHDFGYDE